MENILIQTKVGEEVCFSTVFNFNQWYYNNRNGGIFNIEKIGFSSIESCFENFLELNNINQTISLSTTD